jgi:hypothetical protein
MPTPRAKGLMALFGLKYPIFEAPHGSGFGSYFDSMPVDVMGFSYITNAYRTAEQHNLR